MNTRSVRTPSSASLDLVNNAALLEREPQAVEVAKQLNAHPNIDRDGDASVLTRDEWEAALQNPYVTANAKAQLARLESWFGGAAPVEDDATPPLPAQKEHTSATGARVLYFAEDQLPRLEQVLRDLAESPLFAEVLRETTIILSPPGQKLDALFGPAYAQSEGFANEDGVEGYSRGLTYALTDESLRKWFLGAGHELLHLLEMHQGEATSRRIKQVWDELGFKVGQPNGYPNPKEMFAYFGQWYLAGFGHLLPEPLQGLFAEVIGSAHVDAEGITEAQAQQSLDWLLETFRSGENTFFEA
jgi:hypothetical protein